MRFRFYCSHLRQPPLAQCLPLSGVYLKGWKYERKEIDYMRRDKKKTNSITLLVCLNKTKRKIVMRLMLFLLETQTSNFLFSLYIIVWKINGGIRWNFLNSSLLLTNSFLSLFFPPISVQLNTPLVWVWLLPYVFASLLWMLIFYSLHLGTALFNASFVFLIWRVNLVIMDSRMPCYL